MCAPKYFLRFCEVHFVMHNTHLFSLALFHVSNGKIIPVVKLYHIFLIQLYEATALSLINRLLCPVLESDHEV